MTNPDNVGGLDDYKPAPLSEELRIEAALWSDLRTPPNFSALVKRLERMANQAEKLERELCSTPVGSEVDLGLIEALGYQKQCDEDGTMCIVNRQAVDKAIALLRKLQHGADYVMVPRQILESMRDSSTDQHARGFARGALAAASQDQEGVRNG